MNLVRVKLNTEWISFSGAYLLFWTQVDLCVTIYVAYYMRPVSLTVFTCLYVSKKAKQCIVTPKAGLYSLFLSMKLNFTHCSGLETELYLFFWPES